MWRLLPARTTSPGPDTGTVDRVGGERTLYEVVGGDRFFTDLVDRFYEGVDDDPLLRPMYPDDLTEPKRHLAAFLVQYWGGPATYSEERGHPRLRMRHLRFRIGAAHRDSWLRHMRAAIEAMDPPADVAATLDDYFTSAADFLVNTRTDRRLPLGTVPVDPEA